MIRTILISMALFFLPFALYVAWLWLRRLNPFTGEAWTWVELTSLTVAGLFLSLVLFGLGWRHSGELISGRNTVQEEVGR